MADMLPGAAAAIRAAVRTSANVRAKATTANFFVMAGSPMRSIHVHNLRGLGNQGCDEHHELVGISVLLA